MKVKVGEIWKVKRGCEVLELVKNKTGTSKPMILAREAGTKEITPYPSPHQTNSLKSKHWRLAEY